MNLIPPIVSAVRTVHTVRTVRTVRTVPVAATVMLALVAIALIPTAAAYSETVYLHDQPSLHIAPEAMSVRQGDIMELAIDVPSNQKSSHDFVIEGYENDAKTQLLQPGQGTTLTFTADKPGSFEYYCTVPGHKEAGMRGTLTVQAVGGTGGNGGSGEAGNESPGAGALLAGAVMVGAAVAARRRS